MLNMADALRSGPDPKALDNIFLISQQKNAAASIANEIKVDAERKRFAESFCFDALLELWNLRIRRSRPDWFVPGHYKTPNAIDNRSRQLAAGLATLLSRLDPVLSGYILGTVYASLLPTSIRSTWGVYYTPPPLVERLLSDLTNAGADWTTARVVDPSCGGAAFLAPVAVRVWEALSRRGAAPREILDRITANISGVEIDPFAAWMSQTLTEMRLFGLMLAADRRLSTIVRTADALSSLSPDPVPYDLVIGNPPYGKVSLESVSRLGFARSLYGHPNLYGLFTDLALRISTRRALVGFVTPTSFLAGQYFKALRKLLSAEAPPIYLDFVKQREGVFEDALQETVLVVFKKGALPRSGTKVNTLDASRSNGGIKVRAVTRISFADIGEGPWLVPRNEGQQVVLKHAIGMKHRLSDYNLEVVTGQLVWNRHKAQLRREKSSKALPLIWAESIMPNGTFRFRAHRTNHMPFFALKHDQAHLVTKSECLLLQRTTAKEQHRRLICAILPQEFISRNGGGVVVENHINIIRTKDILFPRPELLAVGALLNSEVVDQLFRCISGSVAVSAYELNALPLPSPDQLEEILCILRETPSSGRLVEDCVAQLYGAQR
jgi:adenine-specific DNA-methyltransferase